MLRPRLLPFFIAALAFCLPAAAWADFVVRDVKLVEYDVPRTHAFVTSKGTTNSCHGVFVLITADDGAGHTFTGLGDMLPRGLVTSENFADCLTGANLMRNALLNQHLPGTTPAADVDAVRGILKQFDTIANSVKLTIKLPPDPDKQLRATLCGYDESLLDLVAQIHGVPIYKLFGDAKRPTVRLSANTSGADENADELGTAVDEAIKSKLKAVRVKVGLDAKGDADHLKMIAEAIVKAGAATQIWIDANQAWHTADVSIARLSEIRDALISVGYTGTFICEQPTSEKDMAALAAVTAQARTWAKTDKFAFLIMADEAVWTLADAKKMVALDAADALNIKIQKAGGLLASMDIAQYLATQSPNTQVYIGGVVSTDVTSWANLQLCLALPRLDYVTAVIPRRQYTVNVAATPIEYASGGESHTMKNPSVPGLGTQLNWDTLQPLVKHDRHHADPATTQSSQAPPTSQP